MEAIKDKVGDLLRDFYAAYGRPEEGPPPGLNVSSAVISVPIDKSELDVLRGALDDQVLRRQFETCRDIIEDLATDLTDEKLLKELTGTNLSNRDFEELSSGVMWFNLAAALDNRDGTLPQTPFDNKIELPLAMKVQMTVQGSLVLRLYIALVYMREGVLKRLISQGARAGY